MAIVLDGTNGIDTPDLASAGPISGTTGTFSGAVQASGVATNLYPLVSGTAVASTSGTSIDFTGIPSWVKRITVMFAGVSTSGTSALQIQIGDSGGFETSSYVSSAQSSGSANPLTSGFSIAYSGFTATTTNTGVFILSLLGSNTWTEIGNLLNSGTSTVSASAGYKTLSDTLDRIRITTINGTDTFDAGTINILYE